jgi:hypothetical protein
MSSEDSRCNVHLADVDGHEEPFNYCSIHHLDYYVDFKPEDRPTWEKYTDDCIRALALKAQALRKQAKEAGTPTEPGARQSGRPVNLPPRDCQRYGLPILRKRSEPP